MALRNAFGALGLDQTLKDIQLLLSVIATRLGQNDGVGRMLVNVGAGTVAATQSGTWTVQPGNTPNTTAWLVNFPATGPVTGGYGTSLDQHYASQQAFGTIRDRITVT